MVVCGAFSALSRPTEGTVADRQARLSGRAQARRSALRGNQPRDPLRRLFLHGRDGVRVGVQRDRHIRMAEPL